MRSTRNTLTTTDSLLSQNSPSLGSMVPRRPSRLRSRKKAHVVSSLPVPVSAPCAILSLLSRCVNLRNCVPPLRDRTRALATVLLALPSIKQRRRLYFVIRGRRAIYTIRADLLSRCSSPLIIVVAGLSTFILILLKTSVGALTPCVATIRTVNVTWDNLLLDVIPVTGRTGRFGPAAI